MKDEFGQVNALIESYRDEMVDALCRMIPLRAVSPSSGGNGETGRADFLEGILRSWGFDTKRYEYTDGTGTKRPSILTKWGSSEKTVWFVAHIDTVSEGDRGLWSRDPFKAVVEGDKVYGRGTDDNGQGVVSSMYALRALKQSGIKAKYNFGLALVADEEVGSRFGMERLVEDGAFGNGSMFVVPDWGNDDGSSIEVGEKGLLWLKITVKGLQVHASTPDKGKNAFRYSMRFLNQIDSLLHTKYSMRNSVFRPDISTFEMTKHELNVESTNIVPGIDVFYMDCRVLPEYSLDDVLHDVMSVAALPEFREVTISVDVINRGDPAPMTRNDAGIVKLLGGAIADLRGISTKTIGIGGGTCAVFARRKGMDAVVWATLSGLAHQPNEYARISGMVNDAKVFAYMLL